MNDAMNSLTEFLGPIGSGALGHALIGLLILVVGLIAVKFLAGIVGRALKRVGFLSRVNADGSVTDLVSPLKSLIKAVLTVFVLMAVLQHFGLTDVLTPLRDMVNKFTSAVPRALFK